MFTTPLTREQFDRQMNRWLSLDTKKKPAQDIECMDCGARWYDIPSGFVYDDPGAGWHQDPYGQIVIGHCAACVNEIEAGRDVYGGRGTDRIEQRTIEDETWVWRD